MVCRAEVQRMFFMAGLDNSWTWIVDQRAHHKALHTFQKCLSVIPQPGGSLEGTIRQLIISKGARAASPQIPIGPS